MEQGSVGSLPDCTNTTLSTVQSIPPQGDRTDEPVSSGSQPWRPRRHQGVCYQFQWTFEMNCDLYSMYQKARSEGQGYTNRLLQYWIEHYPNLSFSRQHLRDQASRLARNSAFCAQHSVCIESNVPESSC